MGFPSEITTTLARSIRGVEITVWPWIRINQRNTLTWFDIYFCKKIVRSNLTIPPPSFMHEKDNIIPASKGDGPLHLMLSVWNEFKKKC